MNFLEKYDTKYCTECGHVCEMYEQGLSCRCDHPWITEVYDESKYPDKWIDIQITVHKK